jgi:hypothetical protein
MPRTFVAYRRVSTDQQGRSGLGLEAQQAAIAAFLQPDDKLLTPPFTAVESGKNSDRPQPRSCCTSTRPWPRKRRVPSPSAPKQHWRLPPCSSTDGPLAGEAVRLEADHAAHRVLSAIEAMRAAQGGA